MHRRIEGEAMNENPYASPRAYGERRQVSWESVVDVAGLCWSSFWCALGVAAILHRLWSAF